MRMLGVIALLMLTELPMMARAQELSRPTARQGGYISLGALALTSAVDDDTLGSLGTSVGGHVSLRLGQMLTEHFGVGIGLFGDFGRSVSWSSFGGGLAMEGQFVPWRALAVRAAVGFGALALSRRKEAEQTDDDPSGIFGARYQAGVSYDWFPLYTGGSGGFAVTVLAEAFLLPGDGIISGGALLGVELSYFLGLRSNQMVTAER